MNIVLPESPLQKITHPLLSHHNISLTVKRDDLLHPIISGNKWRKLKYNLIHAQQNKINHLISFGGPFSNHIHALAAAGRIFGFKTSAYIRGPELDNQNPTLRFAKSCDMRLIAVDRITYRQKDDLGYLASLSAKHPNCLIIPEGGTNSAAILGVIELAQTLHQADVLVTPVGSAGTLAGLIEGAHTEQKIIGIAVLKQAEYLIEKMNQLSPKSNQYNNWQLMTQFHGGGYGKFNRELWHFCQSMQAYHLPLEPIYSGKMFFALFELIKQGYFQSGTKISAIHTGGLQGIAGLKYCGRI
ncbi:pyridoxal-phosphate dependent enzyme [Pseudoalteromonas tunicata]|uniref:1-aminocyclopropane-1-carboxylate deaminase/D-cysteine desulfhydrase n=1 Tax=Pseudoalteromonas tunicata TaxID=314281 RepID=UPI00273FE056|nr:pyridoxal-phosphate dependent enzyme [Pseudoalteromonas tunicata]MDP5212753.1 pyridoxal-phosphate dependent enzyme [Pseudoalteromonas tunicata]